MSRQDRGRGMECQLARKGGRVCRVCGRHSEGRGPRGQHPELGLSKYESALVLKKCAGVRKDSEPRQ